MAEVFVPYLISEEQMERLRKITTDGMSPVDMFISIMQMGSKGHIDKVLSVWEKIGENQHENPQ